MVARINRLIVEAIEAETARNRDLCAWLLKHPNSAVMDLIEEGIV